MSTRSPYLAWPHTPFYWRFQLPASGDYIIDLVEGGAKLLVFGHYMAVLDGLEQRLCRHKVGYVRIDGSVLSSDRRMAVEKFQRDTSGETAVLMPTRRHR